MSERLSITQTVDQINTQLKPAFDSLKSAYQDIFSLDEDTGRKLFSLDDVDISTFEAVRAELEKLDEIDGITVDYSSFERFVSVLSNTSSTAEEVQAQFDALATSIIYATDCTNMSAETYDLLVKSLTEMGVTNADEVLSNLRDIQEELVDLGYDVANITADEAAELINLGSVSAETTQYLRLYLIQKELAQNPLNTIADITALEDLCNALGVTGELYKSVIALKDAFDAKERGAVSAGLDESIEYYQGKIAELANGQADFKFSFSTPDTSKTSGSKSSSSKDTIDTFDWIQQAIENVEKEIEELDEVVNSAYSTFSQKNDALAQEISKVSDEIDLQQQAYDEYMRKADSIGLPEHYKELVQSGTIGIEDIADENLRGMIDEYQKWYDKAIDASNAIKDLKTDMKDLYVNAYELQTDNLKDMLDSDSITEKQYLEGLKTAYEKFYAELEDFAQQYHEAVLDYLDKEKDYLNNVAGAASSLLDTEIDNIRDDADAQESSLKRQIDLLEAKKKPLQDELDALEDKARKENLIYNLQKAQYALARAEYQRPKLMYSEEKGLHYTNDPQAIKDAKKGVDEAKLEIQKQSIQDQIDALDDEIDRYNDLIDQINNAADNQIDALEKIKNKWQEVIDQQEYAKNVSLLTGEFGADVITKILTGNDDDLLAQWKNNYINTLAGIDMESQGYIGNMTQQIASLYGVDLSPLQSQFQGVKESVNGMTDALSAAANAVGIGNVSNNIASDPAVPDSTTAPSANAEPSLESAIVNETETAMNAFDQHTDKLTNEVIPAIQAATQEMNTLNETADIDIEKTITIHYETTGDKSSGESNIAVGKAHIEGTAKVSGDWSVQSDENKALVGELGRELIVRNGQFFTVGDNGAEMTDIKKGDIVFNHEQTEELLKNGRISGHGKAYADGTVGGGKYLASDGGILRPLQPGDKMYDLQQKFDAYLKSIDGNLEKLVPNSFYEHNRQMNELANQISYVNSVVNNNRNQPVTVNQNVTLNCPNLTNNSGIEYVQKELGHLSQRALQEPLRDY